MNKDKPEKNQENRKQERESKAKWKSMYYIVVLLIFEYLLFH